MTTFGAVRVVGGVALLGENVQAGKQAQRLVEVKVADVAPALFVQQLQGQQAQQGTRSRHHARTRIAGLMDELVELQPGQQRQEQENTCHTSAQTPSRGQG
jgi:hypothetical protein